MRVYYVADLTDLPLAVLYETVTQYSCFRFKLLALLLDENDPFETHRPLKSALENHSEKLC